MRGRASARNNQAAHITKAPRIVSSIGLHACVWVDASEVQALCETRTIVCNENEPKLYHRRLDIWARQIAASGPRATGKLRCIVWQVEKRERTQQAQASRELSLCCILLRREDAAKSQGGEMETHPSHARNSRPPFPACLCL